MGMPTDTSDIQDGCVQQSRPLVRVAYALYTHKDGDEFS